IEASKSMVELENLRIKETFCGMRSGSHDFKPLLGRVIDSAYMLQSYPKIKLGYKKAPLKYCKNLYVFNGLGGRGFVLAPLMAKWLIEYIFEGKELDSRVDANRLFLKWARRLNKLKGDTPKDKNG
ncbi:MAG TPA: FAD-dependent oxidoreductase, partial [Nitratifractor sp.]|nr:FAD-dependent oxidoreductase [Nitratifractor sp.]